MLVYFVIQISQMIPVFLFKISNFHQYVQIANKSNDVNSFLTKKYAVLPCAPDSQPTSSGRSTLSLHAHRCAMCKRYGPSRTTPTGDPATAQACALTGK